MNELGYCICGKELKQSEFFCSDRCKWIGEKLNSSFGSRMDNMDRAVRLFGKLYDKKVER